MLARTSKDWNFPSFLPSLWLQKKSWQKPKSWQTINSLISSQRIPPQKRSNKFSKKFSKNSQDLEISNSLYLTWRPKTVSGLFSRNFEIHLAQLPNYHFDETKISGTIIESNWNAGILNLGFFYRIFRWFLTMLFIQRMEKSAREPMFHYYHALKKGVLMSCFLTCVPLKLVHSFYILCRQ